MPRHSSMEMFNAGDPASVSRKQNYERYRCHDGAKTVTRTLMSSTCSKLISSMSAIINQGALREWGSSKTRSLLSRHQGPLLQGVFT